MDKQTEQKIVDLYLSGKSLVGVSKEVGVGPMSCRAALMRLGIPRRLPSEANNKHSAIEQQVVDLYLSGRGCDEIASMVGCNRYVCYGILERRGIDRRSSSESMIKHSLTRGYFSEIDTEEKAYWLGFLAADGNVCGNMMQVVLASVDEPHLYKFRTALGSDHPISKRLCETTNTWQSRLAISNEQMANDLSKWNIVPRKSLTFNPPTLPEPLQRHFWRGVIDGDGSLYESGGKWHLSLNGSSATCETLSIWVNKFTETKASVLPGHGNIYQINFSGIRLPQTIARVLYQDASVFLDRKMIKYNELMSAVPKYRDWSHLTADAILQKYEEFGSWSGVAKSLSIHPSQMYDIKCRLIGDCRGQNSCQRNQVQEESRNP